MHKLSNIYKATLCLLITLASFNSCGDKVKKYTEDETVQYNPLVESFTAGTIGRKESLIVAFSEALPAGSEINKHISISPKIDGKWTISDKDPRIIAFKPTTEFERGVEHKATLDLKSLFPTHVDAEEFVINFNTLPASAEAKFTSITIDKKDTYTITGNIQTADYESSSQITDMVKWDETTEGINPEVKWTHSNNGKEHYFIVYDIPVGDEERNLTLSIDDNNAGYDKEQIMSVVIPKKVDFKLHSVDYFNYKEN